MLSQALSRDNQKLETRLDVQKRRGFDLDSNYKGSGWARAQKGRARSTSWWTLTLKVFFCVLFLRSAWIGSCGDFVSFRTGFDPVTNNLGNLKRKNKLVLFYNSYKIRKLDFICVSLVTTSETNSMQTYQRLYQLCKSDRFKPRNTSLTYNKKFTILINIAMV